MVHEENEENATFFWKGRFISLTERIISLEIKKKKKKTTAKQQHKNFHKIVFVLLDI